MAAVNKLPSHLVWFLGALVVVPFFGPFAVTLFRHVGVHPRYAISGFPALIVLLSAAIPRRILDHRTLAAVLLLLIMSGGSIIHASHPGYGREDTIAAGHWLDKNVPKDTPLFVTSSEMATLGRFHWPERPFYVFPEKDVAPIDSKAANALVSTMPLPKKSPFYYIVGRAWASDPHGLMRDALKRRFKSCQGTAAEGVEILCFHE
jgi:hypothetical protein